MATVYDKNGGEHNVVHAIDVKEWIAAGYFRENPKPVERTVKKAVEK